MTNMLNRFFCFIIASFTCLCSNAQLSYMDIVGFWGIYEDLGSRQSLLSNSKYPHFEGAKCNACPFISLKNDNTGTYYSAMGKSECFKWLISRDTLAVFPQSKDYEARYYIVRQYIKDHDRIMFLERRTKDDVFYIYRLVKSNLTLCLEKDEHKFMTLKNEYKDIFSNSKKLSYLYKQLKDIMYPYKIEDTVNIPVAFLRNDTLFVEDNRNSIKFKYCKRNIVIDNQLAIPTKRITKTFFTIKKNKVSKMYDIESYNISKALDGSIDVSYRKRYSFKWNL